ncbi:hypothetical protein FACS189449_10350 [Alphaproteobacteria bacterium]|nr:hypothetical protein FACS189449_10350 [Alphaproteobacteria bacterium]
MKTVTVPANLKILAAILCFFASNVNAVKYGKMNGDGSISYTQAQTGDAAARKKVADAQALASKINVLRPKAFNILPAGMDRNEFIYELLNWAEKVIDISHSAKISESLRASVMRIDALNDDKKRDSFNELNDKLVLGRKLLSEAKISDQ